ncbi:hypothetical protein IEQ34_012745 [Dendrobium chrysotoxum]|uniref:Uncharacterized protein n=1 Tax=Dendrobium chrysotoxum TaxID=161865 RepID=A0AAV7GPK7_DENCH|nr:hypothetical protein IEQ34_012745 [Dendrobium chrysotoxum]
MKVCTPWPATSTQLHPGTFLTPLRCISPLHSATSSYLPAHPYAFAAITQAPLPSGSISTSLSAAFTTLSICPLSLHAAIYVLHPFTPQAFSAASAISLAFSSIPARPNMSTIHK